MFRQECGAKIPLKVFGGVAHLVERYIRIVEVVSSSLIVSTNRVPRYADAYRGTSFFAVFSFAFLEYDEYEQLQELDDTLTVYR